MSLVIASLLTKTIYADHATTADGTSFCMSPKAFRTKAGVFGLVGTCAACSLIESRVRSRPSGPIDKYGALRFEWPDPSDTGPNMLGFVDIERERGVPVFFQSGGAIRIMLPAATTFIFDQYVVIGSLDMYARGFLDASVQWGKDDEQEMIRALFLLCSRITKGVSSSFDALPYDG